MDADGLLLVAALCEDDIEGDSTGGGKERGDSCHIDSTCCATDLLRYIFEEGSFTLSLSATLKGSTH